MIYAKLNASCVLALDKVNQKRSDMSKKKPTDEKKAGEKEAETDPFLLASLTLYKLTEYPDPVSFSGTWVRGDREAVAWVPPHQEREVGADRDGA